MKMHPEYETLTSTLMGRMPLSSLDVCMNELLREQHLLTKANLVKQKTENYIVAYSARGTTQNYQNPRTPQIAHATQTSHVAHTRDMSKGQC